jgi:F420-non-reducing hydrogenase small subunit
MSKKVTVATTWLQSCSGCHISLLDLNEELLDVLALIDIKYSTIVDVKEIPEVDVALIEGSVCNEDNEEILREFRDRAKIVVALGTCACFGGVQGLRNLYDVKDVLKTGYVTTDSTVDGKVPSGDEIPKLTEHVMPIDKIIAVDYYLPGCPPLSSDIKNFLVSLAKGEKPKRMTRNLCEECDRTKDKMLQATREFITDEVVSVHELDHIDAEKCFLEQGVLCMGPATRQGCGSRCLVGNMPCRGCMGPTDNAHEQGAIMINALSSILPAGGLMFNEDVVGTGYRYTLPVSIIPYAVKDERNSDD